MVRERRAGDLQDKVGVNDVVEQLDENAQQSKSREQPAQRRDNPRNGVREPRPSEPEKSSSEEDASEDNYWQTPFWNPDTAVGSQLLLIRRVRAHDERSGDG